MTRNIALVCRRNPSDWVSCRSITRNLIHSYQQAFPNAEVRLFFMEESDTFIDFQRLSDELVAFEPHLVSFLDHHPHPGPLLSLLDRRWSAKAGAFWPRLLIHVFGDFTLFPNEWLELEPILRRARPVFICASEKQRELVASFLEPAEWIPFPVDQAQFSFRSGDAEKVRHAHGVPAGQTLFLYTGRLSLQKNVLFLVRAFAQYLQFNPEARLWLAGPIDDIGIPYVGKAAPKGLLAYDLSQVCRTALGPERQDLVRYLGDLETASLRDAYHAADVFVSFSTHNDEDFGMAPAEAFCCGLPLVLSDWGGYSSFRAKSPFDAIHVPVSMSAGRIQPELNAAVKAMAACAKAGRSEHEREAISREALAFCSCDAAAAKLRHLVANFENGELPEFSGFSALFAKLARAYRISPDAPFRAGEGYSELFKELYAPYF